MAWTPWRKIADRMSWYVDHALRIAVCFELGAASPYDQAEPQVVYVGAAHSEAHELERFDKGEHPLQAKVQAILDADQALYYRAQGSPSLEGAQALCAERLAEGVSPPWNA